MTPARRAHDLDLARVDALLARTHPGAGFDLTRPVERELVTSCIAEAVEATPIGRSERWRWLLVDDPRLRAEIARLHALHDPDELDALVAAAPVLVLPCRLGRPEPASEQRDLATFYGDVIPVVAAFVDVARQHGLATAWSTRHLAREADVAALLGVPPNVTQVALVPVGAAADGAAGRNPEPFDPRSISVNHWVG
jgi:nitroreductase